MASDAQVDRLMKLVESLVGREVNVHVHVDGARQEYAEIKKRKTDMTNPSEEQPEWMPGGHPRPYVS